MTRDRDPGGDGMPRMSYTVFESILAVGGAAAIGERAGAARGLGAAAGFGTIGV